MRGSLTGDLFAALSNRQFALLWSGQVVSRLGDHAYTVILPLWVREETGSAGAMGLVLLCTVLPAVLLMPWAGALVDRMSRPRVMFISDLVRAAAALLLAIVDLSGDLNLPLVLSASVAFGLAQAFFQPAFVAVVPEVTPREHLQSANSLSALSQQLAAVVGPAIGALMILAVGPGLGFAFNGLTFIVSAATLFGMNWREIRPAADASVSLLRDIRDGLAQVTREPWIWYSIMLAGVANLTLTGPMRVALPYHLDAERGEGWAFGMLLAVGAVGSMALAFLIGRRKQRLHHRGRIAYGAWQAQGLMLIIFAAPLPLPVLAVAALMGGAALTLFELIWVGTLQEMVPGDMLGRVASVDYVVSFGVLPLGGLAVGLATDAWGGAEVLVVCGIITALVPAIGLLHPRIRNLD